MFEGSTRDWAINEFGGTNLGDKRLTDRLVKIADSFAQSPESPINKACETWHETKAAYRFFANENVSSRGIQEKHIQRTLERCSDYDNVLIVQDTCFMSYGSHKKTSGLCPLTARKGDNVDWLKNEGLIMHNSMAISTCGTPLGLLDQKIYSRQKKPEGYNHDKVPIEEKDSYKWLESLSNYKKTIDKFPSKNTRFITVCDREADIYDFFRQAEELGANLLVRTSKDRIINKKSRYSETTGVKLFDHLEQQEAKAEVIIDVPAKEDTPKRTAKMVLKYCSIVLNPSRNHVKYKNEKLPDIVLSVISFKEVDPPEGVGSLHWMLLSNIEINNVEEAMEKIEWYAKRWGIETFHKVVKSGMKAEKCRLNSAEKLFNYIALISIVAWRIHWLTFFSREQPKLSIENYVPEFDWKILHKRLFPNKKRNVPPNFKEFTIWIARLGGFLARKSDGFPGNTHIWRGLNRFNDLIEGARIANSGAYG